MTLKNIGAIIIIGLFGYLQPGLFLSIVVLTLVIFRKDSYLMLFHLYNFNWQGLKDIGFNKRKQTKMILKYTLVVVILFNIIFLIVGTSQGRDEESKFYNILTGVVEVKALTFSVAENDDGEARVLISINNNEKLEINSSFNYDFFSNESPVYIRYGFYNLDLIPDLNIDTNGDDYFVSGLTGEIHKKELIIGMLKK